MASEKILNEKKIIVSEIIDNINLDNFYNIENLNLSKHENIENLNKIAKKIENLSDYELDAFNAIVQHFGVDDALEFDIYNYSFYPDITNDEELGHYYVDEIYFDDVLIKLDSFVLKYS